MREKQLFKYHPDDFGDLSVDVIHMDLDFDIFDDFTRVRSRLHVQVGDRPISSLALNARNLEIMAVGCEEYSVSYSHDREQNLLTIKFDHPIPPRNRLTLVTETECRPSHHILEGLYYDVSPPGAPPQQITQCQQWGFQRIVPCIDDMTAKCTYVTTITADERYTNLISNGDVSVPLHPAGNGRNSITYENTFTPMAPYLFFLGAGTYATYARRFEYPDGTTYSLELLLPPGSDRVRALQALDILADAILWVYLFTGRDQYAHPDVRREIYRLCKERDRLLANGTAPARVNELRGRLAELIQKIQPGYSYTGTVYREIGMQNSDFGGMENVGNTTISTNRIIPFPQMTDSAYEYMVRVKVHEFYHNLNGSEVTGRSPFELWLNEAVTVHVEEQYHAFLFGRDYSRLQTVLQLLSPDGGTFFFDRSAGSMPVEPDGFNDPNELITGVTYVKAPEFVRMIETLMGKEAFARALDAYHRHYRHSNASRAQWIGEMEKESGTSFASMAQQWLKQTGYPVVNVTSAYDPATRTFELHISQKKEFEGDLWEFPFNAYLVDREGNDIAGTMVRVREKDAKIVFDDVPKPAFLSLNRGYAFYGCVNYEAGDAELHLQVRRDPDLINRYIAFSKILDQEKMRLLKSPAGEIEERITTLIFELLSNQDLIEWAGGQFLTIFESVEDEAYAHRYQALYEVKRAIMKAVALRHRNELIDLYCLYSARIRDDEDFLSRIGDIKFRQAKNICLGILATLDTAEIWRMIRDQFDQATNPSDRLAAFALYLDSSAPDRIEVLERFEAESQSHPVSWEAFLSAVAGTSTDDTVALVQRVERSAAFRIEQTNDQRALYRRFAQNKKKSLQTEEGRKFLRDTLVRLAGVNEYSTVTILSVLGNIDRMEEEYHIPLVDILVILLQVLDARTTPSVYNTVRRLLRGAPLAVRTYERHSGTSLQALL